MKRTSILFGTLSAALVVVFVLLDSGRVSPGPISRVHAKSADIDDDDCEKCHGDNGTTMQQACAECHKDTQADIEKKTGLHGKIENADRCERCHFEHHGLDHPLVAERTFQLAGIPEMLAFKHEGLDYRLFGAHERIACDRCHANAHKPLLAEGEKRFDGQSQTCVSCHEDPHEGKLPDCASCHGQEKPFAELANFAHTEEFPLAGVHSGRSCVSCHPKDGEFRIEAVTLEARQQLGRDARSCSDCHPQPHEPAFLGVAADAPRKAVDATCARCHPLDGGSFTDAEKRLTAEQHAKSGFELVSPHDQLQCGQCHASDLVAPVDGAAPKTPSQLVVAAPAAGLVELQAAVAEQRALAEARQQSENRRQEELRRQAEEAKKKPGQAKPKKAAAGANKTAQGKAPGIGAITPELDAAVVALFEASHPARKADDCAACHLDPHGGQFADAPGGATNCLACHDRHAFLPHTFDLEKHAKAGFKLDGAHEQATCDKCHAKEGDSPRAFKGTEQTCGGCHDDAHRGYFIARNEGDCLVCHTTVDWQNPHGFDHGKHTAFQLDGKHAKVECVDCHKPAAAPDDKGRVFGWIDMHGDPQNCAVCHADVHLGKLADEQGATNCVRCHSTQGFDVIGSAFDHGRDTGFAIKGAHEALACATCHAPQEKDANGRVFGFAKPRFAGHELADCRSCHADVHAGSFDKAGLPWEIDGRQGCVRCHTDESWTELQPKAFDHGVWTGFKLDGAHAPLGCVSCHERFAEPQADGRHFAKARGTDCASCHADVHVGQFAQNGKTDCARCHTTTKQGESGFAATLFDHDLHSRFPLDERHRDVKCASCHREATTTTGLKAVRYKPLGTECGDCHGFGFDDKGGRKEGEGRKDSDARGRKGSGKSGTRDDRDDDDDFYFALRSAEVLLGELMGAR